MQRITPCLWFDGRAEEAARFYASVFKASKIGRIARADGRVLTVEVRLDGRDFLLLNGGPEFKFSEAVSFVVACATQKDLDRVWDRLSDGGRQAQCGWLKDRFGVSWQVVPAALGGMMSDRNPARAERVMQAVMSMKKLDIAALKKAYGAP